MRLCLLEATLGKSRQHGFLNKGDHDRHANMDGETL